MPARRIATEAADVGAWRKASHSSSNSGGRVEVGGTATGVLVRDTTNRAAVLTIPATAWRTLLAEIRSSQWL